MVNHYNLKTLKIIAFTVPYFLCMNAFSQELITIKDESFFGQCLTAYENGIVFLVNHSQLKIPYKDIKKLNCEHVIEVQTDKVKNIQALVTIKDGLANASTRYGEISLKENYLIADRTFTETLNINQLARIKGMGEANKDNVESVDLDKLKIPLESVKPVEMQNELEQSYSFLRNERVFQSDRAFLTSYTLKHTFNKQVEASISTPINYAQRTTYTDTITKNNTFGLGDLRLGLRYIPTNDISTNLKYGLSVNAIFPTGKNPYDAAPSLFEGQSNAAGEPIILDPRDPLKFQIGGGHLAFSLGANIEYKSDPMVYYAGLDVTKTIAKEFYGTNVKPGIRVALSAGYGFIITNNATFIQQIFIQNEAKWIVGGAPVYRSGGNPIAMRFALSHRLDKFTVIEPSVRFSLTNDGTSAVVSVGYSRKF